MSGVQLPGYRQGLLDQVAKGVHIASEIYGIKQASDKSDREQQDLDQKSEAMKRRASGILDKGELQDAAIKGATVSEKPFDGGVPFYSEPGGPLVGYVGPTIKPPKEAKYDKVETYNPKTGLYDISWVEPKPGTSVSVMKAPEKAPPKDETKTLGEGQTLLSKDKAGTWVSVATGTPKEKQPTDVQLGAAGFAKRAMASDSIVNSLVTDGYDPTSAGAAVRNNIPLIGSLVRSDDDNSFNQAKKDFISAVLRKESGAAISKDEYAQEDVKYFPQPGDSERIITQKADSRKRAIATLSAQGGPGLEKVADIPVSPGKTSVPAGTAQAAPGGGVSKQDIEAEMKRRGIKPKSRGASGGY